MMSQRLHVYVEIRRIEKIVVRYGQFWISLLAIAFIGYLYISLQGMFAQYLDSLGVVPRSSFLPG